jgi:hypothetical protein
LGAGKLIVISLVCGLMSVALKVISPEVDFPRLMVKKVSRII